MAEAVRAESLTNVLGMVYVHHPTHDGGDLYLTQFGLPYADLLDTRNWYERRWFERHREKLAGTSAVYRVPTREVNGRSLELVVKNCRVGEDVPLDTHTLLEFINAEFNSPWEEFSLVMEMREGQHGPDGIRICTQEPLAIYVPPERMQAWQSGRSRSRISRIKARHPGIELDILRQYKLIYGWIHGCNVIELMQRLGVRQDDVATHAGPMTTRAILHLEKKGYVVADMKPEHIIIGEQDVRAVELAASEGPDNGLLAGTAAVRRLVDGGLYSVVDYELLLRTPEHEERVSAERRHSYLDDMRDRFVATPLPQHLRTIEVFGVPYVYGYTESTGGKLWVVGRNARLFDYFLPERWRRTPSWRLSEDNEVFYTLTKDHVHIVWKTSRVGERPPDIRDRQREALTRQYGYNSPFEEFAIAQELNGRGVATTYMRAIYMTGSTKSESSRDPRRYRTHRRVCDADGEGVLRREHNYITVRGYYNGPDEWVAAQQGQLCRPMDLRSAQSKGVISASEHDRLLQTTLQRVAEAGFDGMLLEDNDMLVALAPDGSPVRSADGSIDVRICNLELVRPR